MLVSLGILYLGAVHANASGTLPLGTSGATWTNTFFQIGNWGRFDSGQYAKIANSGYQLFRCPPDQGYPPGSWCGTTGWMPLYPSLLFVGARLGLAINQTGLLVSWIFSYLTMVVIWLMLDARLTLRNGCALVLAAVFPGMVYAHAVFPISMAQFFLAASALAVARRRFLWAGLAASGAVLAYSADLIIPLVLVIVVLLIEARAPLRDRVRSLSLAVGPPIATIVALFVGFEVVVGNWRAFLLSQAKYGSGLHNPIGVFLASFLGAPLVPWTVQDPNPGYGTLSARAQTALVAFLVIASIGAALWRRRWSRLDIAVAVYAAVFWLFPLTQSEAISRYRSEALVIPVVVLVAKLPSIVQIAAIVAASIIAVGLTAAFFTHQII